MRLKCLDCFDKLQFASDGLYIAKSTRGYYMPNIRDVTGQTFNFLTAIESTGRIGSSKSRIWVWRCECGKTIECTLNNVQSGKRKSCGCKINQAKEKHLLKKHCIIRDKTNITQITTSKVNALNTSGHRGVSWMPKLEKWSAKITFQKVTYYLGVFEEYDIAVAARKHAEEKYFGRYLASIGIGKSSD